MHIIIVKFTLYDTELDKKKKKKKNKKKKKHTHTQFTVSFHGKTMLKFKNI